MNLELIAAPVISEAASEKPKRGRPKAFADTYVATLATVMGTERKTRRTQLKNCYSTSAVARITGSELSGELLWLCDSEKMTRGDPGAWRPELLAELGMVHDDAAFFELAKCVCGSKPKTKRGIQIIRKLRKDYGL